MQLRQLRLVRGARLQQFTPLRAADSYGRCVAAVPAHARCIHAKARCTYMVLHAVRARHFGCAATAAITAVNFARFATLLLPTPVPLRFYHTCTLPLAPALHAAEGCCSSPPPHPVGGHGLLLRVSAIGPPPYYGLRRLRTHSGPKRAAVCAVSYCSVYAFILTHCLAR